LLAVVSLGVAFYALRIALRTDAAISSTSDIVTKASKNTEQIAQSLSTSYIGKFPDTLPKIIGALQEAENEILVLCDVPGYGIFSKHDPYLDYESILRKKAQHVTIKIAVLGSTRRKQILNLQFGSQNLDILRKTDKYEAFRKWGGPDVDKIKTISDFVNVMAGAHDRIVAEFLQTMKVRQYNGDIPVYLWLIDDKVAVLSIPNLERKNPVENAFLTRDPRLIAQLANIFNSYWSSAK